MLDAPFVIFETAIEEFDFAQAGAQLKRCSIA